MLWSTKKIVAGQIVLYPASDPKAMFREFSYGHRGLGLADFESGLWRDDANDPAKLHGRFVRGSRCAGQKIRPRGVSTGRLLNDLDKPRQHRIGSEK